MTNKPQEFDVIVGGNIRKQRTKLGMSLDELAKKHAELPTRRHKAITYQQLQKYETAINKVRLSLAVDLCEIMSCTLSELYEDDSVALSDSQARLTIRIFKAVSLLDDQDKHAIYDMAKNLGKR